MRFTGAKHLIQRQIPEIASICWLVRDESEPFRSSSVLPEPNNTKDVA